MTASVLDLRRRMGDVLRALDRNEPVTITYRGRVKGTLYPVGQSPTKRKSVAELPGFGMWKDRADMADVPAYVRKLRRGRGYAL